MDTTLVAPDEREPRQVALVSRARRQLAEAHSIDEVKEIRDQAEALRAYRKMRGEGIEARNEAAEVILWAERRAGEMLAAMPMNKGSATRSHDVTASPPTLAEQGIGKMESSRWQSVASIPEPEFEAHVEEAKAAGKELTTNGVLKLAKERKGEGRVGPEPRKKEQPDFLFRMEQDVSGWLGAVNAAEGDLSYGLGGILNAVRDWPVARVQCLRNRLQHVVDELTAWIEQLDSERGTVHEQGDDA